MDAKDLAIHYSPIFESLRFFWTLTFFIYSIDSSPDQNKKKNVAREIIRKHIRNESGVISIHRFSVPRSACDELSRVGLVFCLELAPMPENKGYRSEIRGFSSDFMDVRSKKSRALKFKPKILIYAL